jgi:hypothetical protein
MSKSIGKLLIIFGFLLFIVGGVFKKTLISSIGFWMIILGIFWGLRILRKEEVLDTWAVLIENAKGKAEEIFQGTEAFLKESKAPSLKIERKEMAPRVIRGIFGEKRNFLIVTDKENFRLKPYQIFINARDYGENLDVSWFLTYRLTLWQRFLSLIPFVHFTVPKILELDLFDQMDLRAYATNVHHCLLKAVEKLMIELNQDFSKVDRKSKGFLGIS